MPASKQWQASRGDFKKSNAFDKRLYSSEKYKDLYNHFKNADKKFDDNPLIKLLSRKIVEEVSNIIQWNKSWTNMKVRTTINAPKTRYTIDILYDGGEYFDPKTIGNVMGSTEEFESYKRSYEIDGNGNVKINVDVVLKKENSEDE